MNLFKSLIIFVGFSFLSTANSQDIGVSNLYAFVDEYTSPGENKMLYDTIGVPDTSLVLGIGFKLNDLPNFKSLHFEIQNSNSGSITMVKDFSISYDSQTKTYSLNENNTEIPIMNEYCFLTFLFNLSQYEDYSKIELYGEDTYGVKTPVITYKL